MPSASVRLHSCMTNVAMHPHCLSSFADMEAIGGDDGRPMACVTELRADQALYLARLVSIVHSCLHRHDQNLTQSLQELSGCRT